jgi:hypothetical protein
VTEGFAQARSVRFERDEQSGFVYCASMTEQREGWNVEKFELLTRAAYRA